MFWVELFIVLAIIDAALLWAAFAGSKRKEGLASSIRTAVRSAPPRCDGLLLTLCDQVAVTAEDLRRLYFAWPRHPILLAAALHGGAPGLPAVFPQWPFGDLLELRGDRDPRLVLRRNVDRLVRLPMPNAAFDLDPRRICCGSRPRRPIAPVPESAYHLPAADAE